MDGLSWAYVELHRGSQDVSNATTVRPFMEYKRARMPVMVGTVAPRFIKGRRPDLLQKLERGKVVKHVNAVANDACAA
ncbi:hypothetical protein FNV43_RR12816 [Rhamnella rubrinervis]|uniref:Uncharacterized protein n=1 Tax=Rhamnella rubrinervis TaxID=2594499 RepID=A0A8K0H8Z5_9ROSA|nr:hypothetical protein FNV43_RR12816 [Rhamnella rubrinervis]